MLQLHSSKDKNTFFSWRSFKSSHLFRQNIFFMQAMYKLQLLHYSIANVSPVFVFGGLLKEWNRLFPCLLPFMSRLRIVASEGLGIVRWMEMLTDDSRYYRPSRYAPVFFFFLKIFSAHIRTLQHICQWMGPIDPFTLFQKAMKAKLN